MTTDSLIKSPVKSPFEPCKLTTGQQSILDRAISASKRAYCPYSHFSVGACVEDENGNFYEGCNVENASYGLTNCAERTAIFSGVASGMRKIRTIAIVADTPNPVSPCGACRQVISEFSDKNTVIILANMKGSAVVISLKDILPYGFDL
ncbi:Cytidine deaminase, homotetrameric like protein [Aduncisulcus paluster]|uniref:Cytidine deaminase n=1 Tax=Aduncisulcus paluster TaxID=2918883 RepID=A0ABQ5JZI4_9EUKA|nr:Cytidine deaminase, homotetrameric like protein [Aduncisulcus paluster]|eukprot:gnl/Carplike_NY0171/1304_a1768_1178.p1 GENE.gnl/Carplike_NY0171/1304_a1768_1178~~gnl/Carplike_NY0171/1304_a1768_1178.p1  ORF type:complete len:149 (+),score=24.97 gnl/Carplike_NY0171/1304_a1768_1178:245-691(+)